MMARLWQFLTDRRVLAVLGIGVLAALLLLGADSLDVALIWATLLGLLSLCAWGVVWLVRARLRKRAAVRLGDAILTGTEADGPAQAVRNDAVLRKGMLEAINTIKTSKLGLTRGAAALYELPCGYLRKTYYPESKKIKDLHNRYLFYVNAFTSNFFLKTYTISQKSLPEAPRRFQNLQNFVPSSILPPP